MTFKKLLPGLCIIAASLLWATDATVRNGAFGPGEARTVAFVEHLIAFVIIFPFVFKSNVKNILPESRKDWLLLAILGIGGSALAGTIFTLGVERLGPALAAVFTFLQPIAALILAYIFLKERASSAFYFTALWVIANLLLISFPFYNFELPDDAQSKIWVGASLATLATLIWGGTTVAGKALLNRYSPTVVLLWRWSFAAVFLYTSLVLFPEPVNLQAILSDKGLLSVIYLGVVAQSLAYLIYYQGLKVLPVRVVTFLEVLYPIAGVFIPIWSRGESFSLFHIFGSITLIVSIGILLSLEYPRNLGSEPKA